MLCASRWYLLPNSSWNDRAWHAGGSTNNSRIGIEMTESDCVKYITGSSFVCSNFVKDREMDMPELHSEV